MGDLTFQNHVINTFCEITSHQVFGVEFGVGHDYALHINQINFNRKSMKLTLLKINETKFVENQQNRSYWTPTKSMRRGLLKTHTINETKFIENPQKTSLLINETKFIEHPNRYEIMGVKSRCLPAYVAYWGRSLISWHRFQLQNRWNVEHHESKFELTSF